MTLIKNVLVACAAIWMARLAIANLAETFRPEFTSKVKNLLVKTWVSAAILLLTYLIMGRVKSGGDPYDIDAWRLSGYGIACLITTVLATAPRPLIFFWRIIFYE